MEIKADWTMLEEIEFSRLAKLRMEVSDPEDMYVHSYSVMIFATGFYN